MNENCIITKTSSDQKFSSLVDMFESKQVATNDTISIQTDVTLEAPLVINKKCTIDLCGNTLFVDAKNNIIIKNGVEVTLVNGEVRTTDAFEDDAAVIVQGSRTVLCVGANVNIITSGTSIIVRKKGKCILDSATVCCSSTSDQPAICVEDTDSQLVINAGVIRSLGETAVTTLADDTLVINGQLAGGGLNDNVVEVVAEVVKSADTEATNELSEVVTEEVIIEPEDEQSCNTNVAENTPDDTEILAATSKHTYAVVGVSCASVDDTVNNALVDAVSTPVRNMMVGSESLSSGAVSSVEQQIINLPDSVNVRKQIHIYRLPSSNNSMVEWKGALTILKSSYHDAKGQEYRQVKFRSPGSGVVVTGYARVQDLIKCI